MKETEEDANKWQDILHSQNGRIKIVKISILSKAIYRFNAIPIKIAGAFFTEIGKNNPKIHMQPQKNPNCQSNPEKEDKAGGITPPGFKIYYKAVVIKTV